MLHKFSFAKSNAKVNNYYTVCFLSIHMMSRKSSLPFVREVALVECDISENILNIFSDISH